jgi:pimeloyl-ACP methyl ester carboxylesterase
MYDYRHNPDHYPEFQAFLRQHRPPVLIAWGERDPYLTVEGARAYLRDQPDAELHLLTTGHFALEEELERIAGLIRAFYATRVHPQHSPRTNEAALIPRPRRTPERSC